MVVAAGSQGRLPWTRFTALLKRYPLPAARIVHRYTFASKTLPSEAGNLRIRDCEG
jgi:hypothetical protein